jgi:hypothetical protein
MKAVLKNILFVTLPSLVFMFLLLELVFRFIIPAANQPDYMFDEKTETMQKTLKVFSLQASWLNTDTSGASTMRAGTALTITPLKK